MIEFLSGIYMATFTASGLFFLKFWIASKDRFFLLFSCACELIAIERVALLATSSTGLSIRSPVTEMTSWIYLIRLLAFLLILIAVIDRNRKAKR